jgi:twitching motility protein PilT
MHDIMRYIRFARNSNASDLHLVAGLPPAVRVNGEIVMLKAEPLTRERAKALAYQLLNREQIAHFESEKELCFSVSDGELGRIRVTVYYHAGCPELSVRLCALQISNADELGLPAIVSELARKPNGLVLITGATGMGKTTTLNFMVDLINRERHCKIVTIEDPVEYVHKPNKSIIVQQEVHTDTLSFPRALLHVLRQNPDVIVIGEMREQQTIETALTAAETGHLVLATLHTVNVRQTVDRILTAFDVGQQKQIILQLANSIQGIITQDLIPRADGKGRVLAYEVLVANPAVRAMIRENNATMLHNIITTSRKEGMIAMDTCLHDLYQKAAITYDAAISRAREPNRIAPPANENP